MKKPSANKLREESGFWDTSRNRSAAVLLLTLSLAFVVFAVTNRMKIVEIRDGDAVITAYTLKSDPQAMLAGEGIRMAAADTLNFTEISENRVEVVINRAFPVLLTADGINTRIMATEDMTVGELLDQESITLGEHDLISLPESFHLSANDRIVVQRVELVTTQVTEDIPYETDYRVNSLIKKGRSQVITQGEKGQRTITYADRMIDGVLSKREILSNVVNVEPVTEVVLKGGSGAVSSLDFGYPMDENGIPIGYTKVLKGQDSTAYSAKPGKNRGASGMNLFYGYVAVRPSQIPYGTKMYITSADGSFVYGYAIAADTGLGLLQNVIDLDLYYETYRESQLHGRRDVDVYILPN